MGSWPKALILSSEVSSRSLCLGVSHRLPGVPLRSRDCHETLFGQATDHTGIRSSHFKCVHLSQYCLHCAPKILHKSVMETACYHPKPSAFCQPIKALLGKPNPGTEASVKLCPSRVPSLRQPVQFPGTVVTGLNLSSFNTSRRHCPAVRLQRPRSGVSRVGSLRLEEGMNHPGAVITNPCL